MSRRGVDVPCSAPSEQHVHIIAFVGITVCLTDSIAIANVLDSVMCLSSIWMRMLCIVPSQGSCVGHPMNPVLPVVLWIIILLDDHMRSSIFVGFSAGIDSVCSRSQEQCCPWRRYPASH